MNSLEIWSMPVFKKTTSEEYYLRLEKKKKHSDQHQHVYQKNKSCQIKRIQMQKLKDKQENRNVGGGGHKSYNDKNQKSKIKKVGAHYARNMRELFHYHDDPLTDAPTKSISTSPSPSNPAPLELSPPFLSDKSPVPPSDPLNKASISGLRNRDVGEAGWVADPEVWSSPPSSIPPTRRVSDRKAVAGLCGSGCCCCC